MNKAERANLVRFFVVQERWTYGQLAKYLGVTRNIIAGICHRHAIVVPKSPKPDKSAARKHDVIVPFPLISRPSREEAVTDMIKKSTAKLKAKPKGTAQTAVIMVLANRRDDQERGVEPPSPKHIGPAWGPLPDVVPVRLMDLKAQDCRWPVTEATGWFCGCQVEQGKVYCAAHAARAYTGAPPIIFKKKERRFG